MNDFLIRLGIEHWKPLLGGLVSPPVPLVLLVLWGAWCLPRRRVLGWWLVLCGVFGWWGLCTTALGDAMVAGLTRPPAVLTPGQVQSLRQRPRTAILVLGAGRQLHLQDFGAPDLSPLTMARLRYGAWLARQTGLPLAYSGGIGHANPAGPTEGEIALRVSQRDFGVALRWVETRSRDTNENAIYSVALLREHGIDHVVLVTHGFHQQRALAAFGRAIARSGATMQVLPAPMGMKVRGPLEWGDWMPSSEGFALTRLAWHEWLGWLGGA
ncbi:MAG: YdcF family protein [Burkholderiales bacterium]|nr:YdcF family protein [Burkholderiales bacterium]